jgi:THO complex subunit 3
MPPTPIRRPISKDRFSAIFATAKTQTYYDPSSRGPGSHAIRSIAWNNTGSFVATGGADRLVRIWNPERANVKNSTELRGHGLGVERVAWDPTKDGGLASVSGDGSVKFWDVRSAKCLGEVKTGGENFTLAWHPEGTAVAVGRKVSAASLLDEILSNQLIVLRMITLSLSILELTPPFTLSKNLSRPTN